MSSIYFWQNIPSIHQASLISEIATIWPGDVLVIVESNISEDRLLQGWTCPDFSPARLIFSPKRSERLQLIKQAQSSSDVHIFSGFHAYPETYWTMKLVRRTSALIGVFAERGKGGGILRSFFRRLRYICHAFFWSKRINFILATGDIGVKWYVQCFFSKNKVFNFAYFVAKNDIVRNYHPDIFAIIYVGSFVYWKGLDLLFNALHGLKSMQWILRLVGDGPLRSELDVIAHQLGIYDRIIWEGALSNDNVRQAMADSDLLVLSSRYDGWGAVVNEALLSGTPVVVSDACGAAELIQQPFLGKIFSAGSAHSLKEAIRDWLIKGKAKASDRQRIQKWSAAISPSAGARYLLQIIMNSRSGYSPKINAPWRDVGE